MTTSIWDHLFFLAVFVIFPIYSKLTIKAMLQDIEAKGEAAKVNAYRQVIMTWFMFAIIVLLMWLVLGRSWADLGIQVADPVRVSIGLAISVIVIAVIVVPLRSIYNTPDRHGELDSILGDVSVLMPVSIREENWFKAVSVNAGITEELIFRGYLIWYLQQFVGLLWAAAIAVLLFGLAHSYQGLKQLPGILLVAAVAVGLYLYTNSLWVPILFHIALDALQGFYISRIQRARATGS